ncbi:MAG: putative outer membrane protein [Phenylobacterium sp.]|nr:putative outer membrane protein [Phenylobacterium sp.]
MRLSSAGAILALTLLAGRAAAQPDPAAHFLNDAIRGDNSEMMLGEMAAHDGASPAIRGFGRALHDDHARAREDALRVAATLGMPAPDGVMPEARKERRKLAGLHGRAFDREFARYMVTDHRKDIAEFRKQARRGGPTGELARRTLPDLEKHLSMAQGLTRRG